MRFLSYIILAGLCGCAAPAPQSLPQWPNEMPAVKGRPEQVQKSPIAQKLVSLRPATNQNAPQVIPVTFRINTFKILYPIDPTGRRWSLESTADLMNWQTDTNYATIGADVLVFSSNKVPFKVWRVRLY